MSDETNVTVTVDTEAITEENKNRTVVFTDDQSEDGPEKPGDPANYVSSVEAGGEITWTAKSKKSGNPVSILNIYREGGSDLMQDVNPRDGADKYTATISPNATPGDNENYSITIEVSGIKGLAGDNQSGPIVYNSKQVYHMSSYAKNTWVGINFAPFAIEGIAGNSGGPVIYNGDQMAYMSSYADNSWQLITAQAPFDIQGIAGDNEGGPIIYNGTQLYYMNHYSENIWHPYPPAPVEISGITGNNQYHNQPYNPSKGPIIYCGNQVYYLNQSMWNPVVEAPVEIEGISGLIGGGVMIYKNDQVYYLNNLSDRTWSSINVPAPFPIAGISGRNFRANNNGPIIFSGNRVCRMNLSGTAWKETAPTALNPVHFTIDPKIRVNPPQTI